MKKFLCLVLALLLGFKLPAMAAPATGARPLPVVASFSILASIVKTVGGDTVNVSTLVGPDSDTHTYEPTTGDARALANASLVFVNGLGFEGWMDRLISASGYKGKVIVASQSVTPRSMVPDAGHPAESVDPHAWQDLKNGRIYVQNIAAALAQAMPDQAALIRQRAALYDAQMVEMDKEIRADFTGIPSAQRKIITSHDAFGYFGAAYGISFLAPEGINTDAEPSATEVAKLINQIKAEGVKIVFLENMTSPRLIQLIAKDSGAQLGGTLYSDALSSRSGPAPTYLDMFRNNVPKLKAAMLLNKP